MAHFLYTRAAGIWNTDTDLLASELADIDWKTARAINGDDGGTWAPTDPIIIGGAGMSVSGNFQTLSGAELNGLVLVNDVLETSELAVSGLTTLSGTLEAFGQAFFNAFALFRAGIQLLPEVGPDASVSFSPLTTTLVYTPVLTGARTYTVTDPGVDGFIMIFVNANGNPLAIDGPSGTLTVIRNGVAGTSRWCIISRVSGVMVLVAEGPES